MNYSNTKSEIIKENGRNGASRNALAPNSQVLLLDRFVILITRINKQFFKVYKE